MAPLPTTTWFCEHSIMWHAACVSSTDMTRCRHSASAMYIVVGDEWATSIIHYNSSAGPPCKHARTHIYMSAGLLHIIIIALCNINESHTNICLSCQWATRWSLFRWQTVYNFILFFHARSQGTWCHVATATRMITVSAPHMNNERWTIQPSHFKAFVRGIDNAYKYNYRTVIIRNQCLTLVSCVFDTN